VVDRSAAARAGHALESVVELAAAAGIDWLQLREREFEGRAWLEWAGRLVDAARRSGRPVRTVVNRRLDIALALGADGAHLGFDAAGVADARGLLGDDALVGVSAHTPAEVGHAARAGASYAQLAPIHAPRSKTTTRPPLGRGALEAASALGVPVIAQGGLDADNCGAALRAGAAGIAVTGAVVQARDPYEATAALRAALDAD